MVRIRLMRVGKKKQPSYRLVVADSRSPRDGRIIEAIGQYRPRLEPSEIDIDSDRAVYWLQQGAQPSNTAKKLMAITGAWQAFTGEAPPATAQTTATGPAKPPAAVKATPAASVTEAEAEAEADATEAEIGGAAETAAAPEATDTTATPDATATPGSTETAGESE